MIGKWYYGVISHINKVNADVIMYAGTNIDSSNISTCRDIVEKLKSLKGRESWYCSTLRIINDIIYTSRFCDKETLLYFLIADMLEIEPKIVSENYYTKKTPDSYYDISYPSEIEELCEKAFPKFKKNKTRTKS